MVKLEKDIESSNQGATQERTLSWKRRQKCPKRKGVINSLTFLKSNSRTESQLLWGEAGGCDWPGLRFVVVVATMMCFVFQIFIMENIKHT